MYIVLYYLLTRSCCTCLFLLLTRGKVGRVEGVACNSRSNNTRVLRSSIYSQHRSCSAPADPASVNSSSASTAVSLKPGSAAYLDNGTLKNKEENIMINIPQARI